MRAEIVEFIANWIVPNISDRKREVYVALILREAKAQHFYGSARWIWQPADQWLYNKRLAFNAKLKDFYSNLTVCSGRSGMLAVNRRS